MSATYIPTHSNTAADNLSRGRPLSRQALAEAIFTAHAVSSIRRGMRWHLHPAAKSDLFKHFRVRPRVSLSGEPLQYDQRVLPGSLPIFLNRRSSIFSFPNPQNVTETLSLIQKMKISAVILIPLWSAAPWFNKAAQMATSLPVVFPPSAVSPQKQFKPSQPRWPWIGFKLSGQKHRRIKFRNMLHRFKGSLLPANVFTLLEGEISDKSFNKIYRNYNLFLTKAMRAKF